MTAAALHAETYTTTRSSAQQVDRAFARLGYG
jgi:hypothetical protein